MTHQQLVKEWKEKFEKMFFVHLPYKGKNGLVFDCSCHDPEHKWVISPDARPKEVMAFLEEMTLAAAKGAAEAAKEVSWHDYAQHEGMCVISRISEGRPTDDGGYENKIGDKWYRTRPVDETPKCDCGLDAAISQSERQLEDYFKEI